MSKEEIKLAIEFIDAFDGTVPLSVDNDVTRSILTALTILSFDHKNKEFVNEKKDDLINNLNDLLKGLEEKKSGISPLQIATC